MYRNFTLYAGILLLILSVLMPFGLVPTNVIIMFAVSFAAGVLSITDLVQEITNCKKSTIIILLDFVAISSVALTWIIPYKEEYNLLLQQPSNIATFAGFSVVIFTIGIRNQKFIKSKQKAEDERNKKKDISKMKMDDKPIKDIAAKLAIAEYNSVLEYNNIIVELKKCDDIVYKIGKIHDGWALFHEILVHVFNRYDQPFYDIYLNELFAEFSQELEAASWMVSLAADPDSSKVIQKVKMFGVDMEISSFNTSYNPIEAQKGLKLIKSSLNKWDILKKKASDKYEIYR